MALHDKDWDQIAWSLESWSLDNTCELFKRLTSLTTYDIFKSHSTYQVSLGHAAKGSHQKFLRKLAQARLYIAASDSLDKNEICSELINLLEEGNFDGVKKFLCTYKYLLNGRSGKNVITSLLFYGCSPECLEFVMDQQRELDRLENEDALKQRDSHGFTLLNSAVLAGNLACVQSLLEKGVDINLPDSLFEINLNKNEIGIDFVEGDLLFKEDIFFGQSKTALMYAVCLGDLECVEILLKSKPDLKRVCYKGMNALSYAAVTSNKRCLDLLLKAPLELELYGKIVKMKDGYKDIETKPGSLLSGLDFDFNTKTDEILSKPDLFVGKYTTLKLSSPDSPTGKRRKLYKGLLKQKTDSSTSELPKNVLANICDTALPYAVCGGDIECIQLLLNHCVDVNQKDTSGKTALMLAAENGSVTSLKLLLKNWAEVNKPHETCDEETALMLASKNGNSECVKLLLQFKANIEAVSSSSDTALIYACRYGSTECLNILLENKAKVEVENSVAQTPLIIAAVAGKHECVDLLLKFNARIAKEDENEKNALMYAADLGHVQCLEVLLNFLIESKNPQQLEQGVDNSVNNIDDKGTDQTKEEEVSNQKSSQEKNDEIEKSAISVANFALKSLPFAVRGRNLKCFELLLPHCLNFNLMQEMRKSPLMLACEIGSVNFVNFFLRRGDEINLTDRFGLTALISALKTDEKSCLKILLDHGANPNVMTNRGDTALNIAAFLGRKECMKLLLEYGAKPNVISRTGRFALKTAVRNRNDDCTDLLIKYGASINQKDPKGISTVMWATVSENNTKCLKILLDAGENIDIADFYFDDGDFTSQFLSCPENLEFLLKEGKLCMDKEYADFLSPIVTSTNMSVMKSIKLLLEHNVFDWKYLCHSYNFESVIHLAVKAGVFPKKMWYDDVIVTPLQFAFLNNLKDAVWYLLANLVVSLDDYTFFTRNSDLREKLMEELLDCQKLVSLMEQLCFQPWSIQTLCLVTISTTLSHNGSTKGRSSDVDSLPIPEKFKNILKFNGSHSQLCRNEWRNIRISCKEEPQPILRLLKQIYCDPKDLIECTPDCYSCYGFGLKRVSECCETQN